MKKKVFLIVAAAVMISFTSPANAELQKDLAKRWDDLTELLDDAATLRDKRERLPDKSLLGSDKRKTDVKINKTLAKVREILLSSDGQKLIKRVDQIRERLAELPQEIEEYRNKRISAPISSYNPLTTTVEGYDEKISKAESDIERLNNELSEIHLELAEELRGWGLQLTDGQAKTIFSTVIGESVVENATIYQNVKDVTEQLASLMGQDKGDMGTARRYYAMHLTLIDLLIDTQNSYIAQIDGEWLPQVKQVSEAAQTSKSEANKGLKRSDYTESQKKILRSNISTNELTIQAAEQYKKLLLQQKSAAQKSLTLLNRDREIAMNTYDTVQHVSDISDVIKASLKASDLIATMQPPEIRAFDDTGLREQMDEITKRLRSE